MTWPEAPESIIGTWHIDLGRTMTEHIDRVARARPDLLTVEAVESAKLSVAESSDQPSPVTLTITEDEIVSQATGAAPTTIPYTMVGGNSRLVIVEFTDEEGYKSVSHIRLVEGGIAIEPTNCRAYPEVCERQRARAVVKTQSESSTVEAGGLSIAESGDLDEQRNADAEGPSEHPSQPRWFYFKRAEP